MPQEECLTVSLETLRFRDMMVSWGCYVHFFATMMLCMMMRDDAWWCVMMMKLTCDRLLLRRWRWNTPVRNSRQDERTRRATERQEASRVETWAREERREVQSRGVERRRVERRREERRGVNGLERNEKEERRGGENCCALLTSPNVAVFKRTVWHVNSFYRSCLTIIHV